MKLKSQIAAFIVLTLFSLCVVPLVNIFQFFPIDTVKLRQKSFLYNMDFLARLSGRILYPFGISIDPDQVIVGSSGWLYLGDKHELTITSDRSKMKRSDVDLGRKIGNTAKAWESYLSQKGVKLYRIMIGPNKTTIYPEYMPVWARPSTPNATDALYEGSSTIIDLRKPLIAAKMISSSDLYYKTDTHWNFVGAGIAFKYFAEQISQAAPKLKWPNIETYELELIEPRAGGDLANFLRIQAVLKDVEPITKCLKIPITTIQTEFESGRIVFKGGNVPIGSQTKPLVVRSNGALNTARVLWLRDSFGTAMAPFMAATFSDVLQVHWGEGLKTSQDFIKLIETFKPEYVFVTVVERASRASYFLTAPPVVSLSDSNNILPIQ